MKQLCNSYHQLNEPEHQDRETSTTRSGGHVVAQTPADTWSLEPEDDVDVEECRLRPAGPRSMLGWKPTCLRACLVRWSLRMKHLSQSGHMKRFSPVCVRKCRVSSSDRENFFAQSGHVQWKGRSPKNGERNLTLLLFQDFQPQLRKTASGKKKTVDTFRFFSHACKHLHRRFGNLFSARLWCQNRRKRRFLMGLVASGYETHSPGGTGLRLTSALHHVPNVYNCGIRRCVHRVIVALLGYMRLF